jgi:hypothetical protein
MPEDFEKTHSRATLMLIVARVALTFYMYCL